ncbi:MAG: sialidase family protein [Armatimonadota bacterium]
MIVQTAQNVSPNPGPAPLVISRGSADAGTYQAFPDMCRLKNGDLVAVFYAGYQHVSLPRLPDWPKGGRICLVRSRDDGRTWTTPRTIYDDAEDNRDPHITQLPDGRLALTFFSLVPNSSAPNCFAGTGVKIAYSRDGGETWDTKGQTLVDPREKWFCSAPVRVLPSGTWLLGVYRAAAPISAHGGVLRSTDNGKTWSAPISIGQDSPVPLDAETDVIALKDGTVFAALRCSKAGEGMRYATSRDDGRTWSTVSDTGFHGEAPYLYRMGSGAVLLGIRRRPDTVLYVSRNETLTWKGPYQIDTVVGAYPSIAERKDGSVLIVYYTEGKESHIRLRRFQINPSGIEPLPL